MSAGIRAHVPETHLESKGREVGQLARGGAGRGGRTEAAGGCARWPLVRVAVLGLGPIVRLGVLAAARVPACRTSKQGG